MHKPFPFSTYKGRISRSTFWKYMLPYAVLMMLVGMCEALAMPRQPMGPLTLILSFVFGVPVWHLLMRRCHDRGHSAMYMVLLYVIPILGPWWLMLELGFFKGTSGANRFGPDPTLGA